MLLKNYLTPCLLLLLGEQRAHGYALLARLPQIGLTQPQRNGRYADSGFVYRTLRTLEKDGLVRAAEETPSGAAQRRMYELTPAGREELGHRSLALTETSERVEAFLNRYEGSSPAGPGVRPSRLLPSRLARRVLRRPLEGLNPLRRKPGPDHIPSRRQSGHA